MYIIDRRRRRWRGMRRTGQSKVFGKSPSNQHAHTRHSLKRMEKFSLKWCPVGLNEKVLASVRELIEWPRARSQRVLIMTSFLLISCRSARVYDHPISPKWRSNFSRFHLLTLSLSFQPRAYSCIQWNKYVYAYIYNNISPLVHAVDKLLPNGRKQSTDVPSTHPRNTVAAAVQNAHVNTRNYIRAGVYAKN